MNIQILYLHICRISRKYICKLNLEKKCSTITLKDNGPKDIKTSDTKLDRFRKDIISLFKDEGLSVTIDTNSLRQIF